jgi:putative transposase
LEDGKPGLRRIWNKIPAKIETAIVNLALEEPDLSARELAVTPSRHEAEAGREGV